MCFCDNVEGVVDGWVLREVIILEVFRVGFFVGLVEVLVVIFFDIFKLCG